MNEIIFRKAIKEDCLTLATLKGTVWNTTYQDIYSDATLANYDVVKNKKTFESMVANPAIDLYVALDGDRIIGFMTCGEPYRPFKHYHQEIGLLYILKEYQRRGIGKSFFNIAQKKVKENGYTDYFVSVNKQNTSAISFYLAMGGRILETDERQMKVGYKIPCIKEGQHEESSNL